MIGSKESGMDFKRQKKDCWASWFLSQMQRAGSEIPVAASGVEGRRLCDSDIQRPQSVSSEDCPDEVLFLMVLRGVSRAHFFVVFDCLGRRIPPACAGKMWIFKTTYS